MAFAFVILDFFPCRKTCPKNRAISCWAQNTEILKQAIIGQTKTDWLLCIHKQMSSTRIIKKIWQLHHKSMMKVRNCAVELYTLFGNSQLSGQTNRLVWTVAEFCHCVTVSVARQTESPFI